MLNRLMAYTRMFRRSMKATSLYGGARRLAEAGQTREAFDLVKQALDSLPDPDPSGGDPSAALVVVWTVFYAELAAKLGRPADAHDAIRRALRFATSPFSENPNIRPYVAWLRHQLTDDSGAQAAP